MIKHLPNILTFSRLFLTLVFLVMILYSPHYDSKGFPAFPQFLDYAFIIFIISGVTDILDGMAARRFNVVSKLGRILDPLVDKVLVCGAFLCFAIIHRPRFFNFNDTIHLIIHWSVFAVLVTREAYVTILRHIAEAKGINFQATRSGKFKMFAQAFAIGTVIIKMAHIQNAAWANWFTTIVFLIMIVSTVYSGLRATQRKSWQEAQNV